MTSLVNTVNVRKSGTYKLIEYPIMVMDSLVKVCLRFSAWPEDSSITARSIAESAEPFVLDSLAGDTSVRGTPSPDISQLTADVARTLRENPDTEGWTFDGLTLSCLPQNGEHMKHLNERKHLMASAN